MAYGLAEVDRALLRRLTGVLVDDAGDLDLGCSSATIAGTPEEEDTFKVDPAD